MGRQALKRSGGELGQRTHVPGVDACLGYSAGATLHAVQLLLGQSLWTEWVMKCDGKERSVGLAVKDINRGGDRLGDTDDDDQG